MKPEPAPGDQVVTRPPVTDGPGMVLLGSRLPGAATGTARAPAARASAAQAAVPDADTDADADAVSGTQRPSSVR